MVSTSSIAIRDQRRAARLLRLTALTCGSRKTPAPGFACHDVVREASGDRRWAPLVEASFADFTEAMEDGDTARSTSLVHALAELDLIERGMIAAGSRRGLRALRVARLSLARRSITRHFVASEPLARDGRRPAWGFGPPHAHAVREHRPELFPDRDRTAHPPERPVAPRVTRAADRRGRPRLRIREFWRRSIGSFMRPRGCPQASSGRETLDQGRISLPSPTTRQRLI